MALLPDVTAWGGVVSERERQQLHTSLPCCLLNAYISNDCYFLILPNGCFQEYSEDSLVLGDGSVMAVDRELLGHLLWHTLGIVKHC